MQNNKYILDTNILSYLSSDNIKESIRNILTILISNKSQLTISEISIYELLNGISSKMEKSAMNILNNFHNIKIDQSILIGASRLQNLYRNNKELNIDTNKINLGDRLIATTAILNNSYIITANINDFPRPFFKEIDEYPIHYKKTNILIVQILKPNLELILDIFNYRK